jgi:predicted TIM-barrel fold metal-dependent hydrolase
MNPNIIDAHNHLGVRPGATQTGSDLIARMETVGCGKAVIFPFVEGTYSNEPILQAYREFPDRLIPFCAVNPWDGKAAVDELRRCVVDLGFKGVKLHPTLHGYHLSDPSLVNPIFDAADQLRITVITHGASDLFNSPLECAAIARRFPRVPLLIAHMGLFWSVDQAIQCAGEVKNLYLEVSRVPAFEIATAVRELGPEKVIYGTDSPFVDYEQEFARMKRVVASKDGSDLSMGGNAARILRLA